MDNYTYAYDRWGNRWNQTLGSGDTGTFLSFSAYTNQITTSGYAYDAAGNMTSDGIHSYTYDAEGNVTKVDGGSTATYTYDALNRRVQTAGSGQYTLEFIFDPAGRNTSVYNVGTASEASAHIYWATRAWPSIPPADRLPPLSSSTRTG